MNYIAYDKATSLFPAATFLHRVALTRSRPYDTDRELTNWAKQLQNMDLLVRGQPSWNTYVLYPGVNKTRHVHDELCWTIKFNGKCTPRHSTPTHTRNNEFVTDVVPQHPYRPRPVNSKSIMRKTFDVLDCEIMNVESGVYLAISDEFTLRQITFTITGKY